MSTTVTLTTSFGDITIALDTEKAPLTSENFLRYAREGFFQNTLFHRVIPGFMIQGGGLNADMNQKKGHDPIQNEANNGLKNTRGSLAMARTSDPHSASSQFFINLKDNSFLDFKSENRDGWGYAVFGQVIEGMDVVDQIAAQKTGSRAGHQDVPVEDILIEQVSVSAAE